MKNQELAQIVERVWKDKNNFEELYSATFNTVYHLSYMMMGNDSDAEDVVQEVFIKIHSKIYSLKESIAFNRWMNRVVMNTCKDHLRKKGKDVEDIDFENEDKSMMETYLEEDYIDFLPEELVNKKEVQLIVGKTIQELPEKQKQVILMYYYEDMKAEEIAEVLDCSLTAVYNRLLYARDTLKQKITTIQNRDDIKLYSNALIPSLGIVLKLYMNGIVREEVKARILKGVLAHFAVSGSKRVKNKKKSQNNLNNLRSVMQSKFVAAAVVTTVTVGATGAVINYIYQDQANNQPNPVTTVSVEQDKNNNKTSNNPTGSVNSIKPDSTDRIVSLVDEPIHFLNVSNNSNQSANEEQNQNQSNNQQSSNQPDQLPSQEEDPTPVAPEEPNPQEPYLPRPQALKTPFILKQILGDDDANLLYRAYKDGGNNIVDQQMTEMLVRQPFELLYQYDGETNYAVYTLKIRYSVLYIGIKEDNDQTLYVYEKKHIDDELLTSDSIPEWFQQMSLKD